MQFIYAHYILLTPYIFVHSERAQERLSELVKIMGFYIISRLYVQFEKSFFKYHCSSLLEKTSNFAIALKYELLIRKYFFFGQTNYRCLQKGSHYGQTRIQPMRLDTKGFLIDSYLSKQDRIFFIFIKKHLNILRRFYRVRALNKRYKI